MSLKIIHPSPKYTGRLTTPRIIHHVVFIYLFLRPNVEITFQSGRAHFGKVNLFVSCS
jgi:hypothetical protein